MSSKKVIGTIGRRITYTPSSLRKKIARSYNQAGNTKLITEESNIVKNLNKKVRPNATFGGVSISLEDFFMLVEFPYQRNHVKRAKSKVVKQALCFLREDHCNVVVGVLSKDCADKFDNYYRAGTVFLIDGHTRRYIWQQGKSDCVPKVLNATVHTYETIDEMNIEAYVPSDGISAAKKGSDILRSACKKAGFTPQSKMLDNMDWKSVLQRLGYHLYDEDYGDKAVIKERKKSGNIKTEVSVREDNLTDMIARFRTPLMAFDCLDLNVKGKKEGKPRHLWTGSTKCALLVFLCNNPYYAEKIIENAHAGYIPSSVDDNFHAMFLAMNNNNYPGYDWEDVNGRGSDYQFKEKGESKPVITQIGQETNPYASQNEKAYCEAGGSQKEAMISAVPFYVYWMEMALKMGIHHRQALGAKGSTIISGKYGYFVDWFKYEYVPDCKGAFDEYEYWDAKEGKLIAINS
jgi:hypothetical protein